MKTRLLVMLAASACSDDECPPVDWDGDGRLFLVREGNAQGRQTLLPCNAIQPGQQRDYDLYADRCCYTARPISACETWRITPAVEGVTVDANGLVAVDPTVPPGTTINLFADFGDGSGRVAEATVEVYSSEAHPAQGVFQESSYVSCEDGREYDSRNIEEVKFCGSSFSVSYMSFEVARDYWGRWTYDANSGVIKMNALFTPDELDLEGTLQFDGDEIVLRDMWLGKSVFATEPTLACGHRLR